MIRPARIHLCILVLLVTTSLCLVVLCHNPKLVVKTSFLYQIILHGMLSLSGFP